MLRTWPVRGQREEEDIQQEWSGEGEASREEKKGEKGREKRENRSGGGGGEENGREGGGFMALVYVKNAPAYVHFECA